MNGLFKDLEDEEKFVKFVGDFFKTVPPDIAKYIKCSHTIDEGRLRYAHREYTQNIENFALYLHSSNPDQYKRAGALLHALYKAGIVTKMEAEISSEDIEFDGGLTRLNNGEAAALHPFLAFWETFHNQALAFDLAFGCCQAYETQKGEYSFEYAHNVCRYLKESPGLSIDSCFMLFKSLMTSLSPI